ncbi:hypothetical protein J4474_02860 [Candidatus Pacearchaeota archaeon]|nr:hypothetical protein [Candidatus Pacearchaeota archaeon]
MNKKIIPIIFIIVLVIFLLSYFGFRNGETDEQEFQKSVQETQSAKKYFSESRETDTLSIDAEENVLYLDNPHYHTYILCS